MDTTTREWLRTQLSEAQADLDDMAPELGSCHVRDGTGSDWRDETSEIASALQWRIDDLNAVLSGPQRM
jgi:hypothetical protein